MLIQLLAATHIKDV